MEALILTCFQARILINKVMLSPALSTREKVELVHEIQKATKDDCPVI